MSIPRERTSVATMNLMLADRKSLIALFRSSCDRLLKVELNAYLNGWILPVDACRLEVLFLDAAQIDRHHVSHCLGLDEDERSRDGA